MSQVAEIDGPRRSGGARGKPRTAFTRVNGSPRWSVWVAVIGVELSYVLALVIAVPLGRGAVVMTIALTLLLAGEVARRVESLTRAPFGTPGEHR